MPILFLVAYLWYNERTILRRCSKEAFIESCAAIVIKKVYGIIFEILAGKKLCIRVRGLLFGKGEELWRTARS